jgi:hypothetical protein
MNLVWRIFEKDLRRHWPFALLLNALIIADAISDLQSRGITFPILMGKVLTLIACALLVARVIQDERLIGHEQYWLTRPFRWHHLVLAKALVLAALISAPTFFVQITSLACVGLSPFAWIGTLLWRQLFIAIFLIGSAAACAMVTRNFGQVILIPLLAIIGLAVFAAVAARYVGTPQNWIGYQWIRDVSAAVAIAIGLAAIVLLQYRRRATLLSRIVVAFTMAGVLLVNLMPIPDVLFAIQRAATRQTRQYPQAQILYDRSRAGWPSNRGGGTSSDKISLDIPVRLDGMPSGMPYAIDWQRTEIDAPVNEKWRSGWESSLTGFMVDRGANGWLSVSVDPDFYQQNRDTPVRLMSTLEVTIYELVRKVPFAGDRAAVVPEAGFCKPDFPWVISLGPSCFSPEPRFIVQVANKVFSLSGEYRAWRSYAPFPTLGLFGALNRVSGGETLQPDYAASFYRPAAHIELRLEVPVLVMSQQRNHLIR